MHSAWYIAGILLAPAGLALAAWSLFIAGRARGRVRCPGKGPLRRGCWYDLSGSPADPEGVTTCPECGRRIAHRKDMLRTRRLWKPAGAGAAAVAAGLALAAWPMAREQDWRRGAPATVLVLIAAKDAELATDETWAELTRRARIGRLSGWQRRALTKRLAMRLEGAPNSDALIEVCWVVKSLRTSDAFLSARLVSALSSLDRSGTLFGVQDNEDTSGQLFIQTIVVTQTTDAIPVLRDIAADDMHHFQAMAAAALLALGDDLSWPLAVRALESPIGLFQSGYNELLLSMALAERMDETVVQRLRSMRNVPAFVGTDVAFAVVEAMTEDGVCIADALGHQYYQSQEFPENAALIGAAIWLRMLDAHHGMIPWAHKRAQSDQPGHRFDAAALLGVLCATDRQSLRILRTLAADDDPRVRDQADWTLRNLR